ncbi:hypothetical protein [Pararhizobium sp. IMCC21322]|uniref:hypothetical protein n=1 Tax=Pararhizobium sp. IMCC21322 TaxID=3067903 RepID=UPI0027404C7F|nr:hypothetical protein [Pararhizobium sp. IMCC21322]
MPQQNLEIDQAQEFLNMMRNWYYEAWRLDVSDVVRISPDSAIAIYEDCQHHRTAVSRVGVENEDIEQLAMCIDLQLELDATWRSLYLASQGIKRRWEPHHPPTQQ